MKIEKAIEIKQQYHSLIQRLGIPGLYEADRLSFEALKRCQLARKETSFVGPGLLPGETDE